MTAELGLGDHTWATADAEALTSILAELPGSHWWLQGSVKRTCLLALVFSSSRAVGAVTPAVCLSLLPP